MIVSKRMLVAGLLVGLLNSLTPVMAKRCLMDDVSKSHVETIVQLHDTLAQIRATPATNIRMSHAYDVMDSYMPAYADAMSCTSSSITSYDLRRDHLLAMVHALRSYNSTDISASDRRAAPDDQIGEILATHACPIHGYHLIIARPSGYAPGSSERVIQVEKTNRFFHATRNEVDALIGNYQPYEIDYYQLSQNPGPSGERYCNRDGYMVPTDTDVYQVSLAHYNDYTGQTSIFADNNLEVAPFITVLQAYNQNRVFGDQLPPTCNYGCLDGDTGSSPTDPWGNMNFGEIDFGSNDPRKPRENIHDGNTVIDIPDDETISARPGFTVGVSRNEEIDQHGVTDQYMGADRDETDEDTAIDEDADSSSTNDNDTARSVQLQQASGRTLRQTVLCKDERCVDECRDDTCY